MGASWAVAVLTPEYVVEGTLDSDWCSWLLQAGPETVANVRPVQLWNARLQSAGLLSMPAPLTSHQMVIGDFGCLAVIPRDQGSIDFVTRKNKCQTPIPGQVLVGPYAIRGSIWSPDRAEMGVSFVTGYQAFVVQNAHIESLVPGAKLPSLDAPLAVVWTHLLYSAMVAQAPAAAGTTASGAASGARGTNITTAPELLSTGAHGTAVIASAQPLGKSVRDVNPNADPSRLNDPIWLFSVEVNLPGEAPFQAAFGHGVPVDRIQAMVPGGKLAVAVNLADRSNEVAIDWDKSPLA